MERYSKACQLFTDIQISLIVTITMVSLDRKERNICKTDSSKRLILIPHKKVKTSFSFPGHPHLHKVRKTDNFKKIFYVVLIFKSPLYTYCR